MPKQALGENAAAQATVKDLAEALYGIVAKHPDREDVLRAAMRRLPAGRPAYPVLGASALAKLLVPEGETAPRPPRTRPNRKRRPLSHAA